MRASRRYYATVFSAGINLSIFLGSFIIFGMTLSAAIVGPQFLTPAGQASCSSSAIAAPGIPCPSHALHLFKVAEVIAAIALVCLVFAFVFNTLGLADQESDACRDAYTSTQYNAYYGSHAGYAEVASPTMYFFLGVFFTLAGVCVILASVCLAVASAVTHHDWAFKAVVCILIIGVAIAGLIAIVSLLFRREIPIVANNATNNSINQPIGGYPAAPANVPAP